MRDEDRRRSLHHGHEIPWHQELRDHPELLLDELPLECFKVVPRASFRDRCVAFLHPSWVHCWAANEKTAAPCSEGEIITQTDREIQIQFVHWPKKTEVRTHQITCILMGGQWQMLSHEPFTVPHVLLPADKLSIVYMLKG
jgi:hypothetical protein